MRNAPSRFSTPAFARNEPASGVQAIVRIAPSTRLVANDVALDLTAEALERLARRGAAADRGAARRARATAQSAGAGVSWALALAAVVGVAFTLAYAAAVGPTGAPAGAAPPSVASR